MKKLGLTLVMALAMTTSLFAQEIRLNINDRDVVATIAPVQESGTTLVPLRVVSENLGASVGWDGATQTVTINKESVEIKLVLGSKVVTVNGEEKQLTVAPKSINGTTMVPIRFVSENLDSKVKWDGKSSTVFINKLGEIEASNNNTNNPPKQEVKEEDTIVSTGSEVYVTGEGKKYHLRSCRYVNNTSIGLTLKDAKDRGYENCKVCTPPQ